MIDRVIERLEDLDRITVEDMELLCPDCASDMRERNIAAYKVDEIVRLMDEESKDQALKKKYMDVDTGKFRGSKGERFDNCVKFMVAKGIEPKSSGDTKEDAAKKLCAWIARKKK